MCVIICCEQNFPSKEILKQAWESNPNGCGISWIENDKVKYVKGITVNQLYKMIIRKKVKLPAIIHFRIATIGSISPELCHPFPLSNNVELSLSGECDSALFHNGNWNEYEDFLKIAMNVYAVKGVKIPFGEWSDSRALAWCINLFGESFVNTNFADIDGNNNKIAILSKNGIKRFGVFCDVDNDDGKKIQCSNDYFKYSGFYRRFGNFDNDDIIYQNRQEAKKDHIEFKTNVTNFLKKYGLKKLKKKNLKKLDNKEYVIYSQIRSYLRIKNIKNQLTLNDDQINDLVLKYNHTDKTDKTPIKIALQQDHDIERYDYPDFDYNGYLDEYERFKTRDGKVYYE